MCDGAPFACDNVLFQLVQATYDRKVSHKKIFFICMSNLQYGHSWFVVWRISDNGVGHINKVMLHVHRARLEQGLVIFGGTRKGRKGSGTCIAPIVGNPTTKRSDVDHTVTCKYITSAFLSYKHSLQGDTAANSFTHLATDILLIPRPTEGRKLSWPGWLTHSKRLTHEVVTRQP